MLYYSASTVIRGVHPVSPVVSWIGWNINSLFRHIRISPFPYKIILEEQKDHIFTVSYELSSELALTQPGDRVSMDYMEDPTGVCPALSFDNLEFTQKGSGS